MGSGNSNFTATPESCSTFTLITYGASSGGVTLVQLQDAGLTVQLVVSFSAGNIFSALSSTIFGIFCIFF